ncbi:MAG: S9 family peptidase [Nevskia sp.]
MSILSGRKPVAAAFVSLALWGATAFAADAPPAAAAAAAANPAAIPLKDFAQYSQFKLVRISPNGEYLAATFDEGDQDDLVTISVADKKFLSKQQVGKGFRIGDLWWVGPKRVVFALQEQQGGSLVAPVWTGELLGVDADGSNSKYLFGYRAEDATVRGTNIKGAERRYGSATIINPLPDDPSTALIAIRDWRDGEKAGGMEVARLNVYNGAVNTIDTAPIPGYTRFLADDQGHPRYAVGSDEHFNTLTFVKRGDSREWLPLNTGSLQKARIYPQALSADGTRAFLLSNEGTDRLCAVEQQVATGERKILRCDDDGDLNAVILSFDRQEAIATATTSGARGTQFLNSTHPDGERLARFLKSFPGQYVNPVSATRDGSLVVINTFSDRNPGDYYLFRPKTLKAEYLAAVRDAVDPEQMAARKDIAIKARDGQTVHAILTLPRGRSAKGLPLVVNPHGGPFDVHDDWTWTETPEVLASRGYAVLQVNYRGSGGYGESFRNAGRLGWGTVMINDITDATRSLIAQGIADASRVCIYGGSYGGYASMMSAVREPDLYRCVIAYAGIYDLNLWKSNSDVSNSFGGRTYIDEFIGDEAQLKKDSPLSYIDQLKAPVLIVHGSSDDRVPVSQARALRKALESRKLPYEWLVKDEEGHGFYKLENKIELHTRVLAFLAKNIGPGAPVTATSAVAATAQP